MARASLYANPGAASELATGLEMLHTAQTLTHAHNRASYPQESSAIVALWGNSIPGNRVAKAKCRIAPSHVNPTRQELLPGAASRCRLTQTKTGRAASSAITQKATEPQIV